MMAKICRIWKHGIYEAKKEAVHQNSGILLENGDKVILIYGENSGVVFNISERGYIGSTFRILKHSQEIYIEFLQFFIDLQRKMLRENKTRSAIPHLNKKLFRELLLALPPLSEQRHIVVELNLVIEQLDLLQ